MVSFEKYRLVVFDLDGTIYQGDSVIPGAVELVELLSKSGIMIAFLTNNSARSSRQIAEKLHTLGIDCDSSAVWTSGKAVGEYLVRTKRQSVFVCGTKSLKSDFYRLGIDLVEAEKADCLVIGYDPAASYEDCADAVTAALHASTVLACNKERLYPKDGGRLFPGCGAMVAAVEWCANREVDEIIGKPNPRILSEVAHHYGVSKEDMLMIGDSKESDLVMAASYGCDFKLVGEKQEPGRTRIQSLLDLLKASNAKCGRQHD